MHIASSFDTLTKTYDKTILPKNSSNYFAGNSKLTTFETKNLDTATVTDMSGMFDGSSALTALDVSNFNTSNVTDVAYMFGGRYKDGRKLTPPDTSKFDKSKMTDVDQMFNDMLM